jgi:hypothetical protein
MPTLVAIYPTPPSLPAITVAVDDLETKAKDALGGGKVLIAARNASRRFLLGLVRPLASYVDGNCGGIVQNILDTGFEAVKAPTPIGALGTPDAPVVAQGQTGVIQAATKPVYGAAGYNWRLALEATPTVFVQTVQTTKTSVAFSGLVAGEVYNTEVNAFGTAGTSDWSDDATMMVV